MAFHPKSLLLIVACAATLAACDNKVKDAQADAVRDTSDAAAADIDNKADSVEASGAAAGDAAEKQGDANADAMRDSADAVRDSGERKADAIEAGRVGATTKTDTLTTTTTPTKN